MSFAFFIEHLRIDYKSSFKEVSIHSLQAIKQERKATPAPALD
jgi:hypothetical protein